MAGAQFVGKDAVIAAYNRKDGGTWSLVQGKKICATGEGADQLAEWMDIFAVAQSRAPYTLHLYGDIEPEQITTKDRPLASWDIMLTDFGSPGVPATMGGAVGAAGRIQAHIDKKIADKFDAILEKIDEEPEPEGIDFIEIIKDYAANPHKLGHVIGAVQQLLGMSRAMPAQPAVMGTVGASQAAQQPGNGVSGAGFTQDEEQKYNRLAAVLDRLEAKDPKIIEHLEKLADIAEKDSFTFGMILSRLDAL